MPHPAPCSEGPTHEQRTAAVDRVESVTHHDRDHQRRGGIAEHYRPGDLIWVHDYQLMLVGALPVVVWAEHGAWRRAQDGSD